MYVSGSGTPITTTSLCKQRWRFWGVCSRFHASSRNQHYVRGQQRNQRSARGLFDIFRDVECVPRQSMVSQVGEISSIGRERPTVCNHMHRSIRGILAGSEKFGRASGRSLSACIDTHAQTKIRRRQYAFRICSSSDETRKGERHQSGKSRPQLESEGVSDFRLAQGNRRKCFKKVDMVHGPPTQDPPAQGQSR